jgi:hypothetical protein
MFVLLQVGKMVKNWHLVTMLVLVLVAIWVAGTAQGQENPFSTFGVVQKTVPQATKKVQKNVPKQQKPVQKVVYKLPRNYSHGGPVWYFGRNIQGRRLADHILTTHRPMLMQMYGHKMTYIEIHEDIYTFNNRLLVALHSRLHNAEESARRRKGG